MTLRYGVQNWSKKVTHCHGNGQKHKKMLCLWILPKSQFFARVRALPCSRFRSTCHAKCECALCAQIHAFWKIQDQNIIWWCYGVMHQHHVIITTTTKHVRHMKHGGRRKIIVDMNHYVQLIRHIINHNMQWSDNEWKCSYCCLDIFIFFLLFLLWKKHFFVILLIVPHNTISIGIMHNV